MTLKKNNFNIFPRKYSYGGIMDCLIKSIPLASFYEKKIKIIDLNINKSINGDFFIKNISNKNSYKNLNYNNEKIVFNDFEIIFEKLKYIIKLLILRNKFFSILVKVFFVFFYISPVKAKTKFRLFFNRQNYYNANLDDKNFSYLKSLNINLEKGKLQQIYLDRKSFDIINEEKENLNFKKLNLFELDDNYICFYIREKKFNLDNSNLKKNDDVIWYRKKSFLPTFKKIFENNLKIVDFSLLEENLEIKNKLYFNLEKLNIKSELINYVIAKRSKLFLSTGGGKSELAKLFKKPILRVDHAYNVINNFDFSTNKDHIIFCNIYSKKRKRFLSIKEQFENLNFLFPYIGNVTNFKFNYQDYIMVENSEEEILNLFKNYNFNKDVVTKNKNNQKEIFNIKRYYLEKNSPDYFYNGNSNYPENPLICEDFFKNTAEYSDYLELKTKKFNTILLQQ